VSGPRRTGGAAAPALAALGLAALAAAAAASGCRGKGHAEVEGVLIPQATGVVEAEEGVTLAVDVDTLDEVEVPDAPVVRLAIGRKVPWNKVQELMAAVEARGGRPVLLVGDFHKVKAFRLEDTWTGDEPAIRVIAYVDGKACVQPPGAIEAKCVQSGDRSYIDRAFLRELVREQVKLYHPRVEVELASTLNWADVVRTIDGSRTCCYETRVIVRLAPPS